MKIAFLLLFFVLPSFGQMREVEGNVYDISPLVKFEAHWLTAAGEPLWPVEPHPAFEALPHPQMEGWEIFPDRYAPALITSARVDCVLDGGVILKIVTCTCMGATEPERETGVFQFLKNYPGASNLIDGVDVKFSAKLVGTYKYGRRTIAAYDYGRDWVRPSPIPLTAEQILAVDSAAAAKRSANLARSFRYWSEQAATGDAQGEYMLGEKYRVGEGVAKDLPKARAWLAKSAAQGFHDAEVSLAALPAQ